MAVADELIERTHMLAVLSPIRETRMLAVVDHRRASHLDMFADEPSSPARGDSNLQRIPEWAVNVSEMREMMMKRSDM